MELAPAMLDDILPLGRLIATPSRTIRIAGGILIVAMLIGLLVPGYLYYLAGVFDQAGVVRHLPPSAHAKWELAAQRRRQLEQALTTVESAIASTAPPVSTETLSTLLRSRETIQSSLASVDSPQLIHIAPFFLDPLMFVWPIFFASFGWLVFLLGPRPASRHSGLDRVIVFLLILLIYRWPTWIRNTPFLTTIDRITYADSNWDVSKVGFVVQEGLALITCGLIALAWTRWSDFVSQWRERLAAQRPQLQTPAGVMTILESMTQLYFHWQAASVLLAAAFLPYTFFFWTYVIDNHDRRYLVHALTLHGLWLVSWALISLPLACTWYEWRVTYRLREQSLSSQDLEAIQPGAKGALMALEPPITSINLAGSLIGTGVAFALPVLKQVFSVL
jgi:hypothetical protein